jgi:hypothetical protein
MVKVLMIAITDMEPEIGSETIKSFPENSKRYISHIGFRNLEHISRDV